mmetsp:Transcript_19019/g.52112  ORF Transcript_19019/g.52112 Transcript_19019/m.52112 type:complete len:224 (+) Transcript_19019:1586-2257(+)
MRNLAFQSKVQGRPPSLAHVFSYLNVNLWVFQQVINYCMVWRKIIIIIIPPNVQLINYQMKSRSIHAVLNIWVCPPTSEQFFHNLCLTCMCRNVKCRPSSVDINNLVDGVSENLFDFLHVSRVGRQEQLIGRRVYSCGRRAAITIASTANVVIANVVIAIVVVHVVDHIMVVFSFHTTAALIAFAFAPVIIKDPFTIIICFYFNTSLLFVILHAVDFKRNGDS